MQQQCISNTDTNMLLIQTMEKKENKSFEHFSTSELLNEFKKRQGMVWPMGVAPSVLRQAKRLCLGLIDVVEAGAPVPMETKEGKSLAVVPKQSLVNLDISRMLPILSYLSWTELARWLIARGRQGGTGSDPGYVREYLLDLLTFQQRHVLTKKDASLCKSPVLGLLAKDLQHTTRSWELIHAPVPTGWVLTEMLKATKLTTFVLETRQELYPQTSRELFKGLGFATQLIRVRINLLHEDQVIGTECRSMFRKGSKDSLQVLHLLVTDTLPDVTTAHIAQTCPNLQTAILTGQWHETGLQSWSSVRHPFLRNLEMRDNIASIEEPLPWFQSDHLKDLFLHSPHLFRLCLGCRYPRHDEEASIEWSIVDAEQQPDRIDLTKGHLPLPDSFEWNLEMKGGKRLPETTKDVLDAILLPRKTQWKKIEVQAVHYRELLQKLCEAWANQSPWQIKTLIVHAHAAAMLWEDSQDVKQPWLTKQELESVLFAMNGQRNEWKQGRVFEVKTAPDAEFQAALRLEFLPDKSRWDIVSQSLELHSLRVLLDLLKNTSNIWINQVWNMRNQHQYKSGAELFRLIPTNNLLEFKFGKIWGLLEKELDGGTEQDLFWSRLWKAKDVAEFLQASPHLESLSICHAALDEVSHPLFEAIQKARALLFMSLQLANYEVEHRNLTAIHDMKIVNLLALSKVEVPKVHSEHKERIRLETMAKFWKENPAIQQLYLLLWPSPFDKIGDMFGHAARGKTNGGLRSLGFSRPQEDPLDIESLDAILKAHPNLEQLEVQTGETFDPRLSFVPREMFAAWRNSLPDKVVHRVRILHGKQGDYGKHEYEKFADSLAGSTTSSYKPQVAPDQIRLPEEMRIDKYAFESKENLSDKQDVGGGQTFDWFKGLRKKKLDGELFATSRLHSFHVWLHQVKNSGDGSSRFLFHMFETFDDFCLTVVDRQKQPLLFEVVVLVSEMRNKLFAALNKSIEEIFPDATIQNGDAWWPNVWYKFSSESRKVWFPPYLTAMIYMHLVLLNPDVPRRDLLHAWLFGTAKTVQQRTLMYLHYMSNADAKLAPKISQVSQEQPTLALEEEPSLSSSSFSSARTSGWSPLTGSLTETLHPPKAVEPLGRKVPDMPVREVDTARKFPWLDAPLPLVSQLPPDTAPVLQEWARALTKQVQQEKLPLTRVLSVQERQDIDRELQELEAVVEKEIEQQVAQEFQKAVRLDRQRREAAHLVQQLIRAVEKKKPWTCPASFLLDGSISALAYEPPGRLVYEVANTDRKSGDRRDAEANHKDGKEIQLIERLLHAWVESWETQTQGQVTDIRLVRKSSPMD